MSPITQLVGFGLRQVIGDYADGAVQVAAAVEQRFRDHSRTLPKALNHAHKRAWQALGVALAGDGLLDRVKVFFASGDDKGVREQVQLFLESNSVSFIGTPADFRRVCLDELQRLRKSGRLSTPEGSHTAVAHQAAGFKRHADPQGLVEEARRAVNGVADALAESYPNLARLLRTPTPAGPPLLAAAFCYFFRREVETNDELAHGLFFDGLRQLSASQAKAFGEVGKALESLGGQFDALFAQLGRIEAAVEETHAVAVETHGAVLDIQSELQRSSGETRAFMEQLLRLGHETKPDEPISQELIRLASLGMDGTDYLKTVAPGRIARWRAGAAAGLPEAQHLLALCMLVGAGTKLDPSEGVPLLQSAADQGYARARHSLGTCYYNGLGVEKDDARAFHWLSKAAKQGCAASEALLGMMYIAGRGVPKDEAAAIRIYRKLAEEGYAMSQFFLGIMYSKGLGVKKDESAAFQWMRKSAQQGCPHAQNQLALMYCSGSGIPKDEAAAVKWYRQAAELGNAEGQFSLAKMYENGQGVAQDGAIALHWYRKAADLGHKGSKQNLERLTDAMR